MPAESRSREELRRANLRALLTRVHLDGPTSRAGLTESLGLNRSTIGDLTGHLEALGLVTEVAPVSQGIARRGGRPSLVVVPRSDVVVLAVALDVDRITAAVVGLGGVVLERSFRMHQRGGHEMSQVVDAVVLQCRELLDAVGPVRCLGAGISVPGMVRSDGLVHFAPNLGWRDEPFAAVMTERFGMPVSVDNDASLGALAEAQRGAARGRSDVAFVSGTVGLGGGFLVKGELMRGADGYAGEIGHIPVDLGGATCLCGWTGCWETKVGEEPLLTRAGRLPGGGPPAVDQVIEAARSGDARAAASVAEMATWIGVGLRTVVTSFNPEVVLLGGVLARVWEERQDLVLAGLDRGQGLAMRDEVEIAAAELGQDTALIGAAELGFAPVLADPVAVAEGPVVDLALLRRDLRPA